MTRDLVHWNALHQARLEVFDVDTNIDGLSYHGKTDIEIPRMALARRGIVEGEFRKRLPLAVAVVCRGHRACAGTGARCLSFDPRSAYANTG